MAVLITTAVPINTATTDITDTADIVRRPLVQDGVPIQLLLAAPNASLLAVPVPSFATNVAVV